MEKGQMAVEQRLPPPTPIKNLTLTAIGLSALPRPAKKAKSKLAQ